MGYNRASDIWSRAFDSTNNLIRTSSVNGSGFSVGQYLSTATTYTSNASVPLQVDSAGNLKTVNSYLSAGEDLTNDVQKVENRYSYLALTSVSTIQVKATSGFLHRVIVGMPSCPTITLYDSSVPSGAVLFRFSAGFPVGSYEFNQSLATGLTADATAGGVIPFMSFSYR